NGVQVDTTKTNYTNGLTAIWDQHKIILHDHENILTIKEFELLKLLARNPQRVFSKSELYEHDWIQLDGDGLHTVTVHIQSLRAKLKDAGKEPRFNQPDWGKGYGVIGEAFGN